MTNWNDLKTAPKDGTIIWLKTDPSKFLQENNISYDGDVQVAAFWKDGWKMYPTERVLFGENSHLGFPTYWRTYDISEYPVPKELT